MNHYQIPITKYFPKQTGALYGLLPSSNNMLMQKSQVADNFSSLFLFHFPDTSAEEVSYAHGIGQLQRILHMGEFHLF